MTREILKDIPARPFDLIVIGAGINGCGVARDAAMRGLRVLLLDKGDVGGGTTAWSSRLIHGGLRYLEHGELSLVRESLRERETLLRRVAPHLVRPLAMLVPFYAGRRRGPLTLRAGMLAYDLLSFDKTLPRHSVLTTGEALRRAPGLGPSGLRGAALFYDAQVEYAERLALENALAARESGATVLTYARVERLLEENGRVRGVEFADALGGETNAAYARCVLNVAGPWVDEVLAGAGGARKLIGGTKGSHVVVRRLEGAPDAAVYAEAAGDGRPFFVIPWDGKVLIGTTDERFDGNPGGAQATAREAEYLISETNSLLPSARLTRDDVLYAYSGVRPLPFSEGRAEAAVTRKHFLRASPVVRGLYSVVGGKLTTYRSLSEEAVNEVFRHLGQTPPPCATAHTPLPGARARDLGEFRESFTRQSPLARPSTERLLKVYGTRAQEVLRLASADAGLARVISEETGSIAAEVVHAFRAEAAETLADCLMRRTMVGLNSRLGADALEAAARVAQKNLGWDDARAADEMRAYENYVGRFRLK